MQPESEQTPREEGTNNEGPKAENRQESPPAASPVVGNEGTKKASQDSKEKIQPRVHWPVVWGVIVGIAALFGASSIYHSAAHWMEETIDKTVEKKLGDPKILHEVAEQVRPALIFNSRECVVQNMGAFKYVKNIQVTERGVGDLPSGFLIDFNQPISSPIVTPLSYLATVKAEPARMCAWDFKLAFIAFNTGIDTNNLLFRLEIVP